MILQRLSLAFHLLSGGYSESVRSYHRIIESFGLEGAPRGHLVQPPPAASRDILIVQLPENCMPKVV